MEKKSKKEPKYRRQKGEQGDRAFVELSGQRIYVGSYGSPESREKYHRQLAEWSANGRELPALCRGRTSTCWNNEPLHGTLGPAHQLMNNPGQGRPGWTFKAGEPDLRTVDAAANAIWALGHDTSLAEIVLVCGTKNPR